ncbi:MAG: hypothetical protein ACREQ5_00400 [Candidatus Dormibacteria bacterium]
MSIQNLEGWNDAVESVVSHYVGDQWFSTDWDEAEGLLDDVVSPLISAKLRELADIWETAWADIGIDSSARGALAGVVASLRDTADSNDGKAK